MNKIIGLLIIFNAIIMFIDKEFILGNIMLVNLKEWESYAFNGIQMLLGIYFLYNGIKHKN